MSPAATVEGDERLRLFVALELPEDVVVRLATWQGTTLARADVRIVPREHLHITLAFLGSRPASDRDAVAGVVRDVARNARAPLFRIRRYQETPRVAMLVLGEELVPGDVHIGRANELGGDLMRRLETLGLYRREPRDWRPHVTVARFRTQPGLAPDLPELGAFSPSEVALYSSVLRPSGAQYEVLESCSLARIGEESGG